MKSIFNYWKTGWMFIAQVIMFSTLLGAIIIPATFLASALGFDKVLQIAIRVLLFLIFAPLIGCWVLNAFDRLGTSKYSILYADTKEQEKKK